MMEVPLKKKEWANGDNCVSVVELTVNGGGHDWPGSFGNMDISASAEIWKFVSKYDLNGLINCNLTFNQNLLQKNKKLLHVFDQFGRKVNPKYNQINFYLFDDGTVEKSYL